MLGAISDMKTITLKCEIVTPMISKGSEKSKLEIRVPEIKSSMRYWYRSLCNIDCKDIDNNMQFIKKLKFREGSLFGDTENQASPLTIRLGKAEISERRCEVVGIKSNMNTISPRSTFNMKLIHKNESPNIQIYKNILYIASILGGIGGRSRKGYGVFQINSQELCYRGLDIKKLCSIINKTFNTSVYTIGNSEYVEGVRVIKRESPSFSYHYVKEIYIGKQMKDNQFKGKNEHWTSKLDPNDYRFNKRGRYACPVYVSCIKSEDYVIPIITILNNTAQDEYNNKNVKSPKNIETSENGRYTDYVKYIINTFSEEGGKENE